MKRRIPSLPKLLCILCLPPVRFWFPESRSNWIYSSPKKYSYLSPDLSGWIYQSTVAEKCGERLLQRSEKMCENTRPLTGVEMKQGMITTKCYRAILPNKATIGGQEKLRTLFDTFYTMHWSSPQHFCVSITFTFPYCVCSMMNLFIFSYPWAMLPDNIKKILNLRHGNADFQCDPGRTSQGASACPEEAPQLQPMQLHKQMSFPPPKSHANS